MALPKIVFRRYKTNETQQSKSHENIDTSKQYAMAQHSTARLNIRGTQLEIEEQKVHHDEDIVISS